MSTNTKPLAEWTLEEAKSECAAHENCIGCAFEHSKFCEQPNDAFRYPGKWDLTEKPRFTEDEVADMAAVQRIFRSAVVGRLEKGDVYTSNRAMSLNEAWSSEDRITYLPERLFPSLLPGQSVTIADIIGRTET